MTFGAQNVGRVMAELSEYIASACTMDIPPQVAEKAKHHVLDTLCAMISGSTLLPGKKAIEYVNSLGGTPEATVAGCGTLTSAVNAALANGMLAHADESDDSHAPSGTHPGCAIVPAALAMAERTAACGDAFLRAVVLGYDVGCRMNFALGRDTLSKSSRSTHSIGGVFGAGAAAAAFGLSATGVRHALSYTAQQASGITSWARDTEHIEKAFVFGGMAARNGVSSATMVLSGFTGVDDVLSGSGNFLQAFSHAPEPERLVKALGAEFEIMSTNIKKWPVGSPIQAAVDSLLAIIDENKLETEDIAKVSVRLPVHGARTVNNRHMPDICLQHVMALILVDGRLTFSAVQDYERMNEPEVLEWRSRVELVEDEELSTATPPRQAIVEISTRQRRTYVHRTKAVRGTSDNPMSTSEVKAKAHDLVCDVLGDSKTQVLIDTVWKIEDVCDIRDLRELISK